MYTLKRRPIAVPNRATAATSNATVWSIIRPLPSGLFQTRQASPAQANRVKVVDTPYLGQYRILESIFAEPARNSLKEPCVQ